jgi:site-specific DNA-methyltransferase (adenine-specific)
MLLSDLLIPDFSAKPHETYCGDAFEILSQLDCKIDCVVTSPPYFNQRNYGTDGRELGQEEKVGEFVDSLVKVFNKIDLQPWGNVWVNIGNKRGSKGELLAVPNRFVCAMLDAGWYLIDDVVWAKEIVRVDGDSMGHCMVEPAPGRLNGNGWEPFYRFVKDPNKAWADPCAVRLPRDNCPESHRYRTANVMQVETMEEGRNCTNVWNVGNSRKGKNHFAAYPAALVERPIAMTCPEWVTEKGPRERLIEMVEYDEKRGSVRKFGQYSLTDDEKIIQSKDESLLTDEERAKLEALRSKSGRMDTARQYVPKYPKTIDWTHADLPARPGIVLDPFGGTGTTGEVAIKLSRRFIGIDLYQDVTDRMSKRCEEAYQLITGQVSISQ